MEHRPYAPANSYENILSTLFQARQKVAVLPIFIGNPLHCITFIKGGNKKLNTII